MPRSGTPPTGKADAHAIPRRPPQAGPDADVSSDPDEFLDDAGEDDDRSLASGAPRALIAEGNLQERTGEQADFREQFDEDLYNDRAEAPVQGNTADVAMGDHRFGSDAEAYTEYAHRRPGEDSAVGQSRDPADIADEDDERP
ncbi:MAG: hypothetical protein K0S46_2516 [Moraxellaceae bacterium]|jgi:hypothetical protein|nr:hypothetical protein [Moraxellaceae bacterium]